MEIINNKSLILKKIKSHYGFKKDTQFADFLGIAPQTLSGWYTRNTFDYELLYSKCVGINAEWLLTGVGDMFKVPEVNALETVNVMYVPLVSQYAYAGYLGGFGDNEFVEELPKIPFITEREYKGKYFAFEMRGRSMDDGSSDSYLPGDVLLGREIQKIHWRHKLHINKWDFIIVHRTDGILVKRITEHNTETGEIKLHSLNPEYEDSVINLNDVAQILNICKVERSK